MPNHSDTGTQHDYAAPGPSSLKDQKDEPKFTFYHDLNPSGRALQKNVTADRTTKEHVVVWSRDDNIDPDSIEAQELEKVGRGRETGTGDIIRTLKIGDVLTVWAKARYGQWVNHVEEVRIDVYWAV